MKLKPQALAALALAACTLSANAQTNTVNATVKLSNLSISVIDLTPQDGQTATYQIVEGNAVSDTSFAGTGAYPSWKVVTSPTGWIAPTYQESINPDVTSWARVTETGAEAWVSGTGTQFGRNAAFSLIGTDLRISANTRLVISGSYEMSGSFNCPLPSSSCSGGANFSAQFFGLVGDFFGEGIQFPGDGNPVTRSGNLLIAVDNSTLVDQNVRLRIYGSASAQTGPAQAVPEPAMLGLVAAGLSMVAMAGRRRRQRD